MTPLTKTVGDDTDRFESFLLGWHRVNPLTKSFQSSERAACLAVQALAFTWTHALRLPAESVERSYWRPIAGLSGTLCLLTWYYDVINHNYKWMQRSPGSLLGIWVRGKSGVGWLRLLCGRRGVFCLQNDGFSRKTRKRGLFENNNLLFHRTEAADLTRPYLHDGWVCSWGTSTSSARVRFTWNRFGCLTEKI